MSTYWHLVCHETKSSAMVATGSGDVESIVRVPEDLVKFLRDHQNKKLELMNEHDLDAYDSLGYREYGMSDDDY